MFGCAIDLTLSHILLSAWFAWCLVFVSWGLVCVNSAGIGLGRVGVSTIHLHSRPQSQWVCHS